MIFLVETIGPISEPFAVYDGCTAHSVCDMVEFLEITENKIFRFRRITPTTVSHYRSEIVVRDGIDRYYQFAKQA